MKRSEHINCLTLGIAKIPFLLTAFLLWTNHAFSQSSTGTIQGVLIDEQTREAVPSANIYLSNTTIGVPSKPDGTFRISNIPPGNYDLIITYIGYRQMMIPVSVRKSEEINLGTIELTPQPLEMDELEVTSSRPRRWRRELRRFEKAFLGSSFNANHTRIDNPEVLSFSRDKETGRLIAEAARDLKIINESLGYIIFLSLLNFSWDTDLDIGGYVFTSRFEEIETENRREARKWMSNRKVTYRGSFQHFLDDMQHGFLDSKFEVLNGTISKVIRERDEALLYNTTEGTSYTAYRMIPAGDKNPLVVRYDGVAKTELYGRDNNLIVLDSYGNLVNPENIIMAGYWFGYRIADLLPLDYSD